MFRLRGSQAYSSFRIEKLLATIQVQHCDVQQIDTEYQHLVKLKDESDADQPTQLTEAELTKLESLLRYGPKMAEVEHSGQRIFVVPRF
ncbi:MAG: phosphoribosylformylglycinamidine synthase, partial [Arenicella sp.]